MSADMFHLAWFFSKGFGPKAWKHRWHGSDVARFTKPDTGVFLAQALERAGFDYFMIEDSSNVPYTYQGSHNAYLKHSVDTPKLDPTVLAPYLLQATKKLGIVVTCSTTEYQPFMLARLMNTLDHVGDGRIGWNVVTGSNDGGAQNYNRDKQWPHDERYDMADEFMEVCKGLWTGWDDDALVLDLEKGIFADGDKVHPIHHDGKYFKVRGPLSAPPSPQRTPVICQAGGSPRGHRFAGTHAETVITSANNPEDMKRQREAIRQSAVDAGRDPDNIKVLFLVSPVIDETMEMARMRYSASLEIDDNEVEYQLASLSRQSGIDFSQFALDEPLPAVLESNGHQSMVKKWEGKVLNDIIRGNPLNAGSNHFVGTADYVAAHMDEVMQEVRGDGFLFVNSYFSRRYVTEITDGLVPELQKRGLTRTAYEHDHFRDNLMAF
ncbi:NtaA/DmoA family FMN-dependent monooxygenase [Nocardioides bruguierae]|uniref:NtaA/DmoA family FMN-dependent monooxygenase n=1 Tax=Nocardioides bruguierae TaxID=2945102 RepID=A0A9X2IGU4_9ACTN|nr:NtaA/DmoA family FMN-dependent monooxygenase [Nocardioides bruguierae]MCM0621130.1 NtaA/DmoA family FMN-dependent monooxygenase [Nocardioides bruguierae]